MISKKTRKPKAEWEAGRTKFRGDEDDCSRPKDKITKRIAVRRENFQEAQFQEELRKKQVNKKPIRMVREVKNLPCKNPGCRGIRRHGSAYCGKH